ncbi:MAG: ubiquinone biosynthesis hydroxylase, UbiH/UbiF/VisC/COQ6 family protein [Paucimonas sp.]|jgi:2-octaprenyl-6-methoxyphenol hydroxylase|nr:ubiquinone biosynthesis hydroxylase, UbiH/UbiF/VisC/COQ6 family protein [Paucimonas sp.]
MTADFDIAICGAGPVGLALAASLVKRGTPAARIALIDAKPLDQTLQDPRSIALSYGSRQLLEEIDAWPTDVTAIHEIHVSRRGHFGRTLIERDEYGLPALGYVTRYGTLVASLAQAAERTGIAAIRPVEVQSITESSEAVELTLSDGRTITSAILVQAEGGVFSNQIAKSVHRAYEQTALVAHVVASAPVAHRAFERFTDEGPLALLPQNDGYAMVWCGRPATVAQLVALKDDAFLEALQQSFGTRVGRFTNVSARNSFPLGLNAHPVATLRTVAIGNAAQTLHPVAGQGLNLGLRDATVLARLLAQDAAAGKLLEFTKARQSDRSLTIQLTDTMARLFANAPDGAWSQTFLGWSLGIVDALRPAKRLLAEQMMYGRR